MFAGCAVGQDYSEEYEQAARAWFESNKNVGGKAFVGSTKEEDNAIMYGAMTLVTVKVVDDRGIVVPNATLSIGYGLDGDNIEKFTNANGLCVISNKTGPAWGYTVSKDGHYDTDHDIDYESQDSPIATDKNWLPYGRTNTVILKRKINPIPMLEYNVQSKAVTVPTNAPIGFDLMKADWLPPYGQGQSHDVDITFLFARPPSDTPDMFNSSLILSFPVAGTGVYKRDSDMYSQYKTQYSAATSAGFYQTNITFVFNRRSSGYADTKLQGTEHLIFRFQPQGGAPGEFYYGKIEAFDWSYIEIPQTGRLKQLRYYINPTINDPNLEEDRMQLISAPPKEVAPASQQKPVARRLTPEELEEQKQRLIKEGRYGGVITAEEGKRRGEEYLRERQAREKAAKAEE
jgi:hypothetical protein